MSEAGKCVACAKRIPADLSACEFVLQVDVLQVDALEHAKMKLTTMCLWIVL